MKWHDVTAPLTDRTEVWPGDVPFSLRCSHRLESGDPFTLASVTMSLHAGSHLDAPAHAVPQGATVDEVGLEVCVGPARLVTLPSQGLIGPEGLLPLLRDVPPRLLFRLQPGRIPGKLPAFFPAFSAASASLLVESGVRLVGVDTPSVDAVDDETLPAHRTLASAGVVILENLHFQGVPDGDYELIALPLRIPGAEASPVRAILRETSSKA